ncbi:MAG: hypothetical protein H0U21_16485 [Acidimicrobiia bacterium]|nr:hypothetical protein [Acidimicrobiia bacterium]
MTEDIRRLVDLATGQHGAMTAGQIGDGGIDPAQLRRRIQSGILDKVGSRTFRSPFNTPSEQSDLHALVLDCGRDTFVSGPTAAALHGFDGFRLRTPFHVTVVRGRNVQRAHHFIHTTTTLPAIDRATVDGFPVMSAARTLIDIARFVSPTTLTAALDAALRDRLTTEELLHARIVELRSSGRYGIPKLLAVIDGCEASRGGHSWLECRFLELCERAGLPLPQTQQVLSRTRDRVVRVDCRFAGTAVVVEVLGYRWHRTREQMACDAERMNALVLDGLRPMQFTYDQVTAESPWVVAQLRHALSTAA